MNKRAILLAMTGVSFMACGRGEPVSSTSAPILNGRVLTPPLDALEPAVSILRPNVQPGGSGTLLSEQIIITARHVVTNPKHPIATLGIGWGNSSPQLTANLTGFVPYPAYLRSGVAEDEINGEPAFTTIPADIAVAFTDRLLGGGGKVPVAELDCDPPPIDRIRCVSGIHHLLQGTSPVPSLTETINDAFFDVHTSQLPNNIIASFGPNTSTPPQDVEGGDSGMGCFRLGPFDLAVVENSGSPTAKGTRRGFGTYVAPFCKWLREVLPGSQAPTLELQPFAVIEQQLDNDQQPDLVKLVTIAPGSQELTIDETRSGAQTFPVSLPGVSSIPAMTIGNFTGTRAALAVVADGKIQTVSFNDGPQPAVTGATASDYVMVSTARLNGDKIDDLVAQHADGGVEAFIGGPGGLQLSSTIKPIPIRVDRDTLPDFVWFTPGTGQINVWSSINGVHANTLTNQLKISDLRPGHFRRGSGASAGIEDVVTLDTDTAGGGTVVWCDSTEASVECHSATDAHFISLARNPVAIEVSDTNADGLDDVTVSYAETNQPPRVFLATPNGLPSAPAAAPAKSFLHITTVVEGGNIATIGIDNSGQNNTIQANAIDGDGNISSPIDTGIAFVNPVTVVSGNFNNDGVASALTGGASALTAGESPFEDVAILSGGQIFALISNQDGTFSLNTLNAPSDIVSIASGDVTGDGVDDLQATRDDGSVIVFNGISGAGQALSATGDNFTGLPTADGNDGKLLLLSGLGVDTVGATDARLRISATADDPASLDHLTVQIFDGDNGGFNQFDKETNILKTCYQLTPDPCGDGTIGNCNGGTQAQTPIVTVSSDTLHDNAWDTIYTGPHSPAASLTGNGQAPFTYQLHVYMASDCSQPPAPGTQIHVATADGFKVRATGMVSQPLGEFSLVGSDSRGPFGLPNLPYMPATNYDGSFSLPIAVGSSATEIILKESDADSLLDSTPGVSLGANSTIQYQLLRPDGTQAPLVGAENTTPTLVVTNPSGNNDGVTAFDVESRTTTITTPTPGTWIWKWDNVGAANAFHVFSPFGSPTTHEVLGARRARPTVTTAQQPTFFQSAHPDLPMELPIVLGHQTATQALEGSSFSLSTQTAVQSVLDNTSATLQGELERQLLTAKLNVQRSLALGEDINGALVYGRVVSVRSVLRDADNVVANIDPLANDARVTQLIGLLSSINLGELNYQLPGVPFPNEPMADDDGDGVVNVKDNCPTVANPLQEDADNDRVGDACHVRPISSCVLQRSDTQFDAFFGYSNPLSFRAFAIGARNFLTDDGRPVTPQQPTEFAGGSWSKAFHQSFVTEHTLAWTLDGETIFANTQSARCSGRELTVVDSAPQTTVFGTESVVIGDRSRITAAQDLASIVSGGDIQIGANSVVGNVFAGAHAAIGDYGSVVGTAATGVGFSKRPTAIVNATKTFSLREHSLAWVVPFATTALKDVSVSERQQLTLAPGEYGDVAVEAQAQLILGAGEYRFRSLTVREQGSLRVATGDAVVHVANALEHAGDTRLLSTDASLVIGYFGTQPASIAGSLQAAVIAPNASLTLGTAGHTSYAGTFFAQRVIVSPGTQIQYYDAAQ
jgi:hypothetical protein